MHAGRTVTGMNFGIRLPGPFRVGVSDKGRVTAGVTLGPFSASGQLGTGQSAAGGGFIPCTLDEALHAAAQTGWKVRARSQQGATIQRGWKSAWIRVEQGGVRVLPHGNPRWMAVWILAGLVFAVWVVATMATA